MIIWYLLQGLSVIGVVYHRGVYYRGVYYRGCLLNEGIYKTGLSFLIAVNIGDVFYR